MTLATLPSFTTTCGSVMAPECLDLQAASALMSMGGFAGAVPLKEIVPLTVAFPCGPLACAAAPSWVASFDDALSPPPHASSVRAAAQPTIRFMCSGLHVGLVGRAPTAARPRDYDETKAG